MAGGREMHLRSLQPLALHVVNSLFLGDYLTSEGQAAQADLDMIADAGFTVLGAGPSAPEASGADRSATSPCGPCGSADDAAAPGSPGEATTSTGPVPAAAGSASKGSGLPSAVAAQSSSGESLPEREPGTRVRVTLNPTVRRRGAGTEVAPNA